MSLTPGARLGPYDIVGAIGAGGMGEVYRAHDSRLGRDVAIKILPELFATDPDRLARFEREAKTLASLSHPNIAVIYEMTSGVFSSPSPTEKTPDVISAVLVMELLEGQTSQWTALTTCSGCRPMAVVPPNGSPRARGVFA